MAIEEKGEKGFCWGKKNETREVDCKRTLNLGKKMDARGNIATRIAVSIAVSIAKSIAVSIATRSVK